MIGILGLVVMEKMELENAINETMAVLQPLFSKPKLSSKLLSKPPFRFIHDILTSTIESTGFPDGLFAPQELDSSNFKDDKLAKLALLDKLINLVNVGSGHTLEVSSSKIIAGLEPLNTNILLTEFGRLALDKGLDRSRLVKHCVDGLDIEEYQLLLQQETPQRSMASSVAAVEGLDIILAQEENVSANAVNSSQRPPTEADYKYVKKPVDACNGDINQTREVIARIVTKPKCSDKLLSKPPFRFLHDVFMAIGEATGFNLGRVFRNEEMVSANIKEKQEKIDFLEKLISFLEAELQISIDVKASKIVAGLEAEKTRYLLQVFVVVATTPELIAGSHEDVTAGKQDDHITACNAIRTVGKEEVMNFESEVTEGASFDAIIVDDSDSSPAKTHPSLMSSKVKQTTVPKIPSMTVDEKTEDEQSDKESTRSADGQSEGDKELPMFEFLGENTEESAGVEEIKSTISSMRLRLHRTINQRPSTALTLPSKLSLADLDSIAASVQCITQLTESLGRYVNVVHNDIEAMTLEQRFWVKEIQDMEQELQDYHLQPSTGQTYFV
ncbi:hypothetical protein HJC23_011738 [Cyclotella cryptica]|uniref:TRAF3-interacting protein 1 n=1 Tax=Cyclotella cryptica TaxID=29204 RepID=A0ABD3PH76_9STRA